MVDQTRYFEQALRENNYNLPSTKRAKWMYNDLKKYAKTMQNFILFSITFKS